MKTLPTTSELVRASLSSFAEHGRLFIGIVFVSEGMTFALNVFGAQGAELIRFLFALLALLVSFWGIYALLIAIHKPTVAVGESYQKAWEHLSSYLWVNVLLFFTLAAGFLLFIVPGILAALFFSFAPYVFVAEGVGGQEALQRSYRYVRGYAWSVALRMVPVFLVALFGLSFGYVFEAAYGATGGIAEIALGIFIVPFLAIYQFLLYDSLRKNAIVS